MNMPVLIVAIVSLLAVVAHVFGGTRETASLSPDKENIKLVRSWKQSMCAFQMLAIDLLLVSVLLFFISLTDIIQFEYEITLFLSFLFFLWGVVWLIQLYWLKSNSKTYIVLPQWILWLVCSALLYWGANSS